MPWKVHVIPPRSHSTYDGKGDRSYDRYFHFQNEARQWAQDQVEEGKAFQTSVSDVETIEVDWLQKGQGDAISEVPS